MRRSLTLAVAVVLAGHAPAAWAKACTELPVLFVVQDKSGSMDFDPDGNTATAASPSKWSAAQSVVPALATQFANRFRFGTMMYPTDTSRFNCTTGTVVTPVSADASAVGRAYANNQPGGGTSTAQSLLAAKDYLLAQHFTTPAYVLLITDGLPNCNTALNVNTCSFTTPTCPNNSCNLGAKDCLDDQATVAAASALQAANIQVFVVGFDPTLTTGNNLSVLNAVASAGGTGHAYTATNKAQLASTLNQIALNTATCCKDVCTTGAKQCSAEGNAQACQFDAALGCTVWVETACTASQSCDQGSCSNTCQNQCSEGATRCSANGGAAEQCTKAANGCTAWSNADTCDAANGEACSEGQCRVAPCTDQCADGERRCTDTGQPQRCVKATACLVWQDTGACGDAATCVSGVCRTYCSGETRSCSPGNICSKQPEGSVCLPTPGGDAGVVAARDAGVGGGDITATAMGCSCQSGDASGPLLFWGVLVLMWAGFGRARVARPVRVKIRWVATRRRTSTRGD